MTYRRRKPFGIMQFIIITVSITFGGNLSTYSQKRTALYQEFEDFQIEGMSPDGEKIIGYTDGNETQIWDRTDKQLKTIIAQTEKDDNPKGWGTFSQITNDGKMYGSCNYHQYSVYDDVNKKWGVLNEACVWSDGEITPFDFGTYNPTERWFDAPYQGTYITKAAESGTRIIGYVRAAKGHSDKEYCFPCIWEYNEGAKEYNLLDLHFPMDADSYELNDISDDGKRFIGTSYSEKSKDTELICWNSSKDYKIIATLERYSKCTKISPSGKYTVFNNARDAKTYLYNLEDGTREKIDLDSKNYNTEVLKIMDNGNIIYSSSGYFIYDNSDKTVTPLDSYVKDRTKGLTDIPELNSCFIRDISNDGTTFCGTRYDVYPTHDWYLQLGEEGNTNIKDTNNDCNEKLKTYDILGNEITDSDVSELRNRKGSIYIVKKTVGNKTTAHKISAR